MLYQTIIALLLLVVPNIGHGNSTADPVCALGITDGLAGESVYQVMNDHAGRVWVASSNGVNMYNGQRIVSYRLTDAVHRMVTVTDLCETRDKAIYAATDIGLYRLGMGEERFEQVLPEVRHPECLMAVGDTLYIGGRQGLQVYDGHRLTTVNIGAGRQGIDNIVRHYIRDDLGRVWFFGRYDLYRYDPSSGQFKGQGIDKLLPERATPSQFAIVGNICFVGTKADGLYALHMATREIRRISEVGHLVTSVRSTADGQVCVATNGAGAYLIDGRSLKVNAHFGTEESGNRQLPTNAVNCYYRDRQGVDWLGMVRYGLAFTCHTTPLFSPWQTADFTTAGHNVRCFLRHGSEIVIGTYNGFYLVRPGLVRHFPSEMLGGSYLVNNIAYYRGNYYIGAFDGGLYVLNPRTLELRQLSFVPSLQKSGIGDIVVGPDSLLWVGTSDGLFVIDDGRQYRWFTEQNSRIKGGMVLSITFDRTGNAWLTGGGGLSIYSATSREIVDVNYPDGFFQDEPWCRGFLGHDGRIFMRNGPQIFYSDEKMKDYGELELPVTLPDIWCRECLDDGKGHYWIASEMGLFRMDYDGGNLLRLGESEGLHGGHINQLQQDNDGRIWVATSEGLYQLDTRRLDDWKQKDTYHIHLFNIRRGGDELAKGKEQLVNDTHRISLRWNLKTEMLRMDAVLLDFARQTGQLYEYRLDGGRWTTVLPQEEIVLRNLPLGSSLLEVRKAGLEGTTTGYTISVTPSALAWFELVLLVLAIILLWSWYRYRKNTEVMLQERDVMEEALLEVEHELNEVNSDAELPQKYQRVKIDEKECAAIVKQMQAYIERERVYTNADLKMKDLADVLHLSPSKLSQVFNLYLNENYYEFINRYRLAEFKRLIEAGEYKRYTITALSEQCGFKKSNFFSTFRKVEGMTPAEYLKKQGVKI